jgi:hypothetical protein
MILRPWHIDDIASLVKYANNINIVRWTFPHPFTTANADGLLVLPMMKMLIITLEP